LSEIKIYFFTFFTSINVPYVSVSLSNDVPFYRSSLSLGRATSIAVLSVLELDLLGHSQSTLLGIAAKKDGMQRYFKGVSPQAWGRDRIPPRRLICTDPALERNGLVEGAIARTTTGVSVDGKYGKRSGTGRTGSRAIILFVAGVAHQVSK